MNAMNIPKAFYTRRVTEALASLALHVRSAHDIAASLSPIKTPVLNLQPEEQAEPIIFSIDPPKIDINLVQQGKHHTFDFNVSGNNLGLFINNIKTPYFKTFELFSEETAQTVSTSSIIPTVFNNITKDWITNFTARFSKNQNGDSFTELLNLTKNYPGCYKVKLIDQYGTPHLPGFFIEIVSDINHPYFPLIIEEDLHDIAIEKGATVTFTIKASGSGPILYQWLRDGVPIPGANEQTYTILTDDTSHKAGYSVVVSNPSGIVFSKASKLTVKP